MRDCHLDNFGVIDMPPKNLLNNAKLIIHRKNYDEEIYVMFNPDRYSLRKSNQFASHSIPGTNNPHIQFVSGDAETLSVELFFDTYTYENGKDVRKEHVDKISNLLQIDEHLHAPPACTFVWGKHPFTGIVENVDRNFTMFNEQGIPVRATITLTLKQYGKQQQPKSSPDRTKRHVIKEGDSLWLIAAKEYGDASKWKIIASTNNINDPLHIEPGTQLTIPPLNDSVGEL